MFGEIILGSCSAWSPSSECIATVNSSRVTIRDGKSLETLQVHSCVDTIERFAFSPDGAYIMCCIFSRNTIQVFNIADVDWRCRINEGVAAITCAEWAPDSRSIITVSDFGVQMSIWSLTENSSRIITQPKFVSSGKYSGSIQLDSSPPCCYPTKAGIGRNQHTTLFRFSDCGSFLAVVHRIDMSDRIGIYEASPTWGEVSKFPCKSNDVAAIQWSENSQVIVTIDSPLNYNIHIYEKSGALLGRLSAYDNALGVRSCVRQNTSLHSQTFAIGSYDGRVRLLSARSWRCAHILPHVHPKDMTGGLGQKAVIYTENSLSNGSGTSFVANINKELPLRNLTAKQKATTPDFPPQTGISWIGWCPQQAYMACQDESHPSCLWVWDVAEASLKALVVALDNIASVSWRPAALVSGEAVQARSATRSRSAIAYCTGTSRVYVYEIGSCSGPKSLDIPHNAIAITSLSWSSDGSTLLLQGNESLSTLRIDQMLNV